MTEQCPSKIKTIYASIIVSLCFWLLKTVGITVVDWEDVDEQSEA